MNFYCCEISEQQKKSADSKCSIKAALNFLKNYESYIILGHQEPDGDCLGSQLAFASLLAKLGKRAFCLQAGPFDRPETIHFANQFLTTLPSLPLTKQTAAVVLDCSTAERVGEKFKPLLERPLLVIDHHCAAQKFGDITYTDATAASTTQLVLDFFQALKLKPDPQEASLLFFGLVTDTGFFRHCDGNSVQVFKTAEYLASCGASVRDTYQAVYGNRDLAQRQLLGKMLLETESLFAGKLLMCSQTISKRKLAGANNRSSDELYSLLQTVKGVEVIVFLREETSGLISVGLRSTNSIDVAQIAASHKGGGHRQAAGFNFKGSLKQARKLIIEIFRGILS